MKKLLYYIDFKKKISGMEYLSTIIVGYALFVAVLIGLISIQDALESNVAQLFCLLLEYLVILYVLVATMANFVSRCNDAKLSLWHLVWILPFPPVSTIILFAFPTKK